MTAIWDGARLQFGHLSVPVSEVTWSDPPPTFEPVPPPIEVEASGPFTTNDPALLDMLRARQFDIGFSPPDVPRLCWGETNPFTGMPTLFLFLGGERPDAFHIGIGCPLSEFTIAGAPLAGIFAGLDAWARKVSEWAPWTGEKCRCGGFLYPEPVDDSVELTCDICGCGPEGCDKDGALPACVPGMGPTRGGNGR